MTIVNYHSILHRRIIKTLPHKFILNLSLRHYSPPPFFRETDPPNQKLLHVTDEACSQLDLLRQKFPEMILRVAVEAGGCHGFQYKFSLQKDQVLDEDDV